MFYAHIPTCQCPFASVLPTTMVTQSEILGVTPVKTGCYTAWMPDYLCFHPFECPIIMDIVGFHHIDARLFPFPHWKPSRNHSTPGENATWVSVCFRFHIRMILFSSEWVGLDNGKRTSAIVEGVRNSINMGGQQCYNRQSPSLHHQPGVGRNIYWSQPPLSREHEAPGWIYNGLSPLQRNLLYRWSVITLPLRNLCLHQGRETQP